MPLRGFDPKAGRAYLRARLKRYNLPPVSDEHLDRLVQQVNGNPLGLRLAAQVFAREGLAGVEETSAASAFPRRSRKNASKDCCTRASSNTWTTRISRNSRILGSSCVA